MKTSAYLTALLFLLSCLSAPTSGDAQAVAASSSSASSNAAEGATEGRDADDSIAAAAAASPAAAQDDPVPIPGGNAGGTVEEAADADADADVVETGAAPSGSSTEDPSDLGANVPRVDNDEEGAEKEVEEKSGSGQTSTIDGGDTAPASAMAESATVAGEANGDAKDKDRSNDEAEEKSHPVQVGPFVDLLGESLLSLEMVDEKKAQIHSHYTNEALGGKKVVGLYFSADWCGPCRQFTPDLVNFYNKINSRRGKENEFEIVWISRCRDVESYGQYFTHMNWLALPPQEAMGERGKVLSDKYKVRGIPTLVLLDELGNTITTEGRNKIPMDKAGIGFPWRNPLATIYMTVVPKSLRLLLKMQIEGVKDRLVKSLKGVTKVKMSRA